MDIYGKIEAAKKGNTVTITPTELANTQFDYLWPLTIAELIAMCETFNLSYTLSENPQLFTINNPIPSDDGYFPDNLKPDFNQPDI